MATIVIAAAPADAARANAIAEALAMLGFDVAAHTAVETDLTHIDAAKCVLALWSLHSESAPTLAAQAALALDRKKLVCAELVEDTTPALFKAAPRTSLDVAFRLKFKQRFEALVDQIEQLTETKRKAEAMPEALAKGRAALGLRDARERAPIRWRPVLMASALTAACFALGLGAAQVIGALSSQPILVASPTAAAAVETPLYGLTEAELERLAWRDAAAKIDPAQAARIEADAARGEAFAQTLACLGRMAGSDGFLPSPAAASEFCDAAAAQHYRPALYLSWSLRRSAPHAGIDENVARERLAEAARRGLVPAQVEYAALIAPSDPVEAGRLWLAAAESGDARGQFHYARWLRDSPAGPRDPTAAIPFLERAADAGDVDALHMLATLYRDGVGAPRDIARARALYERAASRDFAPAMFNLADLVRSEDRERAAGLYARLACMREEREISAMSRQRLRAMGRGASCG